MEKDFIESNGEKIYFYVQRKNVKNINLKVNIDKKVTLSIPMKMSLDKAKDFVKKKANWIKKQQDFYDTFAEQKENITLLHVGIQLPHLVFIRLISILGIFIPYFFNVS